MLPDWDFDGDEAKRRTFIEWVWRELDRLEELAAGRFRLGPLPDDWVSAAQSQPARAAHRPSVSDADKVADSTLSSLRGTKRPGIRKLYNRNGAIWEYTLLRWMFERYWPHRTRDVRDSANPLHIAVARNRDPLSAAQRDGPNGPAYLNGYRAASKAYVEKLQAYWERRGANPGLRMARDDIAFLETLPRHLFEH